MNTMQHRLGYRSARIAARLHFSFLCGEALAVARRILTGGAAMRFFAFIFATFLALGATAAQAAISAGERTVLLDLYAITNGATWATNTNWNGPAGTECSWYGVTCDTGGNTVTGIYLGNNNLTGTLPASLNTLTNLQTFYAYSNQLTGTIPALTGLTNLQNFNVFSNQLTGTIPALTGLTNLTGFVVSANQLTETIPALTGLTNLINFNVDVNQLTGTIPALTGLTNLQYFVVNSNQLTGTIPALTGLTNLQYFVVYSNLLSGTIPALTGLTNLTGFYASFNQLTGTIPAFTGLTNLQNFNVYSNLLSGTIPALTGLTNLQYFYVNSNQLTGNIPALTGLTNLKYFYVNSNQLTGNVPSVPSPDALVASGSGLCPNYLSQTSNPAWDTATGTAPWYTSCTAQPTYTVTYNGNTNSGGSAPVDGSPYTSGATVTVLGAGALVKNGFTFTGWNTQANGSGTGYAAGATFAITANTTLYAQWTLIPTGAAPSITSATSATFAISAAGTFSITATGSPTPTLSETGALPGGVTFTDNGNGSATLSGTPAAASNGDYHLTFTAHNSAGLDATQSFTLTILDSASLVLNVSTLSDGAVITGIINKASGSTTTPWPWTAVNGPYSGIILNVSGNAASSVGIQSLTCNGAALPLTTDGSFSYPVLLASGANTITIVATDKAGHQTTSAHTITLSSTGPKLTVTSPTDGTATQLTSVTVTGTVSANSTVAARVNGGSAQQATLNGTDFTVTVNLAAGLNTIELTATDSSNATAGAKLTIVSNHAAPDLAITNPARDLVTATNTVMLAGTVSSSVSPVTVSIAFDGQTFTPAVANGAFQQKLTLSTEKAYPIVVTATDANGQTSVTQRNVIYSMTASGDVNGDGKVNVFDALLALQASVNLVTLTADEQKRADMAPLVQGVPAPDGKIDIFDALLILQAAVNLITLN